MTSISAQQGQRPGRRFDPWPTLVVLICLLMIAPVFAVFLAATGDSSGLWQHLFNTVLPRYIWTTLQLMLGVGLISIMFGVGSAWLISRYEFPGKNFLEWGLMLPAAVPAYIIAYTWTDFFEFAGPVQGMLRDLFGWHSMRDYWFPEIRSMGGASIVMAAVLYPYIYMMTRTAIKLTPATLFEIASIEKRSLFWNVALPLSRPAIFAGLALVLMETVSDFGTVEYFALETLTLGIFNVWLGMNNMAAAAQIASISFLFIITLLVFEIYSRNRRRYTDTGRKAVSLPPVRPGKVAQYFCLVLCLIPFTLGFLLPVGVLLSFLLEGISGPALETLWPVVLNSLWVAGVTAVLVMLAACLMVVVQSWRHGRLTGALVRMSATGYAFPGTILAIGVVTFVGAADSGLEAVGSVFGLDTGGFLSGGLVLVVLACMIRFQAVGFGAMSSGMERLPRHMLDASRSLGHSFGSTFVRVMLPLLGSSFVAGGLLVFVDVMKELPMTLLLRPFNFETLATTVYQYAKDELLEEAALPALMIVIAGMGPVIWMNAVLRKYDRSGKTTG